MTYKEVFELAMEKGYKGFYNDEDEVRTMLLIDPPVRHPDTYLIELSLIQKWLRNEKKVHVQPAYKFHRENEELPPYNVGQIPNSYTSYIATAEDLYFDTYEQALLVGIGEALKQIE